MNKLIVVLGATGGQGGSVVDSFLQAPGWKVRGLTRNASSEKATALKAKGVEMVQGNTDDQTSLEAAFQGAHAIFAFTDYYDYFFELGPERSMARETAQGSNIARAAATIPTLERFVWSTLPNTQLFTEGQAIVPHFQGKANVDVYIKEHLPELYAKTTFTIFTIFGANVVLYDIFRPLYLPSAQKWIQFYPAPPQAPYPSVGDHRINSGIFVRSIVENPPTPGTYVECNVETITLESYLAAWGRASGLSPQNGSTMVVQISAEQYCALWPLMGEEQASQWRFFQFLRDNQLDIHKVEGFPVIQAQDLMSEEARKSLVLTEESLRRMDWSSFKK
ncbi:uncharacterized protein BDW47DRAFT_122999 [Aspergillus candidus]|uniref:NmrA-like domain-containing protein n=1 Tax=Aspergillus candidus TaxID=41067 RepID=A0A2I2FJY3_ASPCN|nr:hypothetical protein BDW47DRAFT_122999 [Aspergillus candidus]PLB40929.1 hypothetical protein BDW47DRAFT_122999 [Aspergillus candidus]